MRITAILSQKIWITAIWSTKIMDPNYCKVEKKVHSYFEAGKLFYSYMEKEKSGCLLFGTPKM